MQRFSSQESESIILDFVGLAGSLVFAWCLFELYVKKHRLKGLITTGIFKYTRHPMYTGLVMMDLKLWFIEYNEYFIISSAVLYIALAGAAFFQEKETLARFGNEAVEYYKKTPRVFLLYPFVSRQT